ncbi:MAG: hypothetical protein HOW97_08895 [Catenulispora sp.]|nr:hypothetical protein [Catenulispora sp.]
MGFAYKTSWIAVRNSSAELVADALGMVERGIVPFDAGTDAAYAAGVYVAPPIGEWTLAHGRGLFFIDTETADSVFASWLADLSGKLGEVQFFSNYRVPECHEWALAIDGRLIRAYGWLGERFEVTRFVGEPTSIEHALGIGIRNLGEDIDDWSDEDYATFSATTPTESDVMKVAGAWSLDPSRIRDEDVPGYGVLGDFDSGLESSRRRVTASR